MAGRRQQTTRCCATNVCTWASPSARNTEQVQYSSTRRAAATTAWQQQPGLDGGQLRDVGRRRSQRVGVAARCPTPCRVRPAGWRQTAGRPTQSAGRAASTASTRAARPRRRRLSNMLTGARVDVQRRHVGVGQLQQMGRLATGAAQASRTRGRLAAPSPPASAPSSSGAGELGSGVPHRHHTIGKARQNGHGARVLQHQALGRHRSCYDFHSSQRSLVAGWAASFLALTRAASSGRRHCSRAGWPATAKGGLADLLNPPARWFHCATGSLSVLATSASRSRSKRRRQPLMNPAWPPCGRVALAASTAWLTR